MSARLTPEQNHAWQGCLAVVNEITRSHPQSYTNDGIRWHSGAGSSRSPATVEGDDLVKCVFKIDGTTYLVAVSVVSS